MFKPARKYTDACGSLPWAIWISTGALGLTALVIALSTMKTAFRPAAHASAGGAEARASAVGGSFRVTPSLGFERAAEDLISALRTALITTDPGERKRELTRLLRSVRPEDFGVMLPLTDGFNDSDVKAFRKAILSRWAQIDPVAALAGCSGLIDIAINTEARKLVWIEWTERSPSEALAWFIQDDQSENRAALEPLAVSLMRIDRRQVVEWLESSPSSIVKGELFDWFLGWWATENIAEAAKASLEWSHSPRLARSALSFCGEWARHDPCEAVRYVATLPPGEMQTLAALTAIRAYGRENPSKAADWAIRFPEEGSLRNEALAHTLTQWMGADPQGVGEVAKWIGKLEPGRTKDAVVSIYIGLSPEKYIQAWAN